jgi:hypothetical protein
MRLSGNIKGGGDGHFSNPVFSLRLSLLIHVCAEIYIPLKPSTLLTSPLDMRYPVEYTGHIHGKVAAKKTGDREGEIL